MMNREIVTENVYRTNSTFNPGYIETIVGTMFSGKSRELLFRGLRAEEFGDVQVLYFKPSLDTRDENFINSRDGLRREAILFEKSEELLGFVNDTPSLILIDEAQFCDSAITEVAQILKLHGHNVVLSGLPTDFRGQPFGKVPELMALSDLPPRTVYSVCSNIGCHNDGILPQRNRNGVPDSALSPTIVIEGSDDKITYQPKCVIHHFVPDLEKYLRLKMAD